MFAISFKMNRILRFFCFPDANTLKKIVSRRQNGCEIIYFMQARPPVKVINAECPNYALKRG